MSKVYYTGFEGGFIPTAGATGWTAAASTSLALVTNGSVSPPGVGLRGTLTVTCPATSGIRGCQKLSYVRSTQADIVTFGAIVLRITVSNTFVIRNNGVDVAGTTVTLSPLPSTGAVIPVEYSIDLSTIGAGAVTFKVNGQTATATLLTTLTGTATSLVLVSGGNGAAAGFIDDICINDNAGGVDNGIPPLISFVAGTLTATGANNAMSIAGLRTVRTANGEFDNGIQYSQRDATYSPTLASFVSLPSLYPQNASGVAEPLAVSIRQTTLANARTMVALSGSQLTIPPQGNSGAVSGLCGIFNDSTGLLYHNYAAVSGASTSQYVTINPSTGAVALGSSNNGILGNVVKVGSNLYYSQYNNNTVSNGHTAIRSDLSFSSRVALTGVGSGGYNQAFFHYSTVADKIYGNVGGTASTGGFGYIANGGSAFTEIPVTTFGASSSCCFGWLEDAANSRLYFFGKGGFNTNTTCFVFNTSNNTFVRQIDLGVQLHTGSNLGVAASRCDANCLRNIIGNFTANKIYFTSQAGVVYQLNLSTDVTTTITTVSVFSNTSRNMPLLGIFGTTLYVFGYDKVTYINTANNAVIGSAGYPNWAQDTNGNRPCYRIYTDGTYFFVPQEYNFILFAPSTNTFEVATSKTQVSNNYLHAFNNNGTATQVSALQGNPTTATQQSFTFSLPVSPSRIVAANIIAPSTFKSGALSASLQLGLKIGGVDVQAGSNQTPPTSPIANITQTLFYKTGTTEITPAELASAEVYAKIV